MKKYEFSLQYPKPLNDEDLGDLLEIAKSGLYSRYTTDYVKKLEFDLSQYYGTKHAVTCTSGTAALHGVLTALDFPFGSEIITTSVADIGIVLPIIYENLVPVFADLDSETYNLSPSSVEEKISKKTKAVIAVHLAGSPADLDSLKDLCEKNNLVLIEDFSQAHGAEWDNKKVGSIGLISYGSFQQSKQITCGEGGVIVTNDENLAYRALIGVDKGWERELPLDKRLYQFLAPNVRFNALQAAILKPQIPKLNQIIDRKSKISKLLYEKFDSVSDFILPQKILSKAKHSYYSFPLYVTKDKIYRNALLNLLVEKYNLHCAYGYANPVPLYLCVNALINPKQYGKGFKFAERNYPKGLCPNAEDLLNRSFLIPFNENFTDSEMLDIADRIISAINQKIA
jgi:perosamine synthetase